MTMEKIEFIASTGLTFYSPDYEIRLPDELLEKVWRFRVLKSSEGAISVQLGETPLGNVTTENQGNFDDIGGISVNFSDIIEHSLNQWFPLLYGRKNSDAGSTKSYDWARALFNRSVLQTDPNRFKLVIAVSTDITQDDSPGLNAQDTGFSFEINPSVTSFWKSKAMLSWIGNLFKQTPAHGSEEAPPHAVALAAYLAFMDGLRQANIMPEICFVQPEGEEIETSLILDLGNSRACGILTEQSPGEKINLDECCKLEIRDLQEPVNVYTEPFDTSFKFMPGLFQDSQSNMPSENFPWPGIVRLGNEAAKMEPSDIGDTGMSSPKRYLWDESSRSFPWYFNLSDTSTGQTITAPFFKYLDENGYFNEENPQPPFEPCYPAGSLMTFMMLEILSHTYAQINSYSYRKSRGQRLAARTLKNVVLTTPCGMSEPESQLYRQRVQSAIDIFFKHNKLHPDKKPELHLELDESTSVQLTYLYGEIKHRFLADAKEAIETLGKKRDGSTASLRLASIDIGGGTSDLMISEYVPQTNEAVNQKMLFSEGFSVAGDEVAKRIIEKIILRQIFSWASAKNELISKSDFQMLFGPGRGGRDRKFHDMKAELCRQVWLPMAHRFLEFAEIATDEPVIEVSFDKFFPHRQPGSNVLDFFNEIMRKEFGVDITLAEIPWQISRSATNAVIANVLDKTLRIFSEIISQFDCDALILGGKPSSLPIIREILVKLMPVPSSRITGLKGYQVGSWYPFSQRGGGIADPKTSCVVGATVWLFAEKMGTLEGLRLTTDNLRLKQRECYIGTFSPQLMTLNNALFPTEGETNAKISVSSNTPIGIRRIDSEICMVNPLYELIPKREILTSKGTIEVELKQNPEARECLEIASIRDTKGVRCPSDSVSIKLKTMVNEKYWLDTGSFDI